MKNLNRKITCNFTKHYGYDTYMDIYYPERPGKHSACVLTLHSGGFYDGARDDELQMQIIEMLISEGFIVASADYRLGMYDWLNNRNFSVFNISTMFEYCVDLARQDCERAIQFLRDKGDELKIDESKIVLAGCSSGAITVLQTEYNRLFARYATLTTTRDFWEPVAVVSYSGAILCDALLFFTSRPAPLLLVHGLKDKVVKAKSSWLVGSKKVFYGSEYIRQASLRKGGACRAIWFSNAEHEVSMAMPRMTEEITEFIDKALRRSIILEVASGEYSIKISDVQYGNLDLKEEAKMWRGKTALGMIKENLQK